MSDLELRIRNQRSKVKRLEMGIGRARTLIRRHPSVASYRDLHDTQTRALQTAREELSALEERFAKRRAQSEAGAA